MEKMFQMGFGSTIFIYNMQKHLTQHLLEYWHDYVYGSHIVKWIMLQRACSGYERVNRDHPIISSL